MKVTPEVSVGSQIGGPIISPAVTPSPSGEWRSHRHTELPSELFCYEVIPPVGTPGIANIKVFNIDERRPDAEHWLITYASEIVTAAQEGHFTRPLYGLEELYRFRSAADLDDNRNEIAQIIARHLLVETERSCFRLLMLSGTVDGVPDTPLGAGGIRLPESGQRDSWLEKGIVFKELRGRKIGIALLAARMTIGHVYYGLPKLDAAVIIPPTSELPVITEAQFGLSLSELIQMQVHLSHTFEQFIKEGRSAREILLLLRNNVAAVDRRLTALSLPPLTSIEKVMLGLGARPVGGLYDQVHVYKDDIALPPGYHPPTRRYESRRYHFVRAGLHSLVIPSFRGLDVIP